MALAIQLTLQMEFTASGDASNPSSINLFGSIVATDDTLLLGNLSLSGNSSIDAV